MVYPPDNMALLRLATKATKQYAPVVKGAKDLRNMVSKYSADLKFSDVTKIRTGHQIKSAPSPFAFREPDTAVPLSPEYMKSNIVFHPDDLAKVEKRKDWNKMTAERNDKVRKVVGKYLDRLDIAHNHSATTGINKPLKTYVMDNDIGATMLQSSDFRSFENRALVLDADGVPMNVFSSYPSPYNFEVKDDLSTIRDSIIDVDYDDVPVEDAPYIGYEPNMYLPEKAGHFKYFNKLSTPNFKQRRLLYDRAAAGKIKNQTLYERKDYVGDKNITTLRIDDNIARQQQIGVDQELFGLGREDRMSPIYSTSNPDERLPRPPLPADTHTHISPTLGLLHAYRLHHAHMYFAEQRKVRKIKKATQSDYMDLDKVNLKLGPIKGVQDVRPYEKLLVRVREELKTAKFGFGYEDKVECLKVVRDLIPIYAAVPEVKVETRRRRRK